MKRTILRRVRLSDRLEVLLYALLLALVFEGIIRKMLPFLATPVFFLKDTICLLCVLLIANKKLGAMISGMKKIWLGLAVLLLPVLFITAFKDLPLTFFAAKQYLLYIITGIAVVLAFPNFKQERFRRFLFYASLLLLPTAAVAVLQNALPASHWLNLSVGGESLEIFSAAGHLRVGSTFSFTAQYSWFLNAETFLLAASYFLPPRFGPSFTAPVKNFCYLLLAMTLLLSAYITGGRTAVIGFAGTAILGMVFLGMKQPGWLFTKGLAIVLVCSTGLAGLRQVKPEFFAAYDKRAAGTEEFPHNREITDRILSAFTDWTEWFWLQDDVPVFFGNGLGVMSNGAERLSRYAAGQRSTGLWTESDFPTTLWEGGMYLAFVWYGFRLALVLFCYNLWRRMKAKKISGAASVILAYAVIHGLLDALGMQPPLSIWWWLSIGLLVCLSRMEKYQLAARRQAIRNKLLSKNSLEIKPASENTVVLS